jgi:aspartyl-tRNA(Asn)/glutamyl-tRNA(Gln) amidotransferase subunit A
LEKTMLSDDPALWPATVLLDGYRRRTISPVEATQLALKRIAATNKEFNALCLVDEDGALASARESEARWAKGAPKGLLDGVPVTIKDLMLTKGWPTLRGSKNINRDQNWEEDAPAVARLRENSAVILGKTTSPEFGWKALGDSPLTGITRNPWKTDRTPGGSSAGAAAAAAAGMGALHTGTDAGGSIRIPAAFCGIVGHKPTHGRVPQYPPSPFAIVAHAGPMTRTVADAALMLNVMARPDDRDAYALPPAELEFTTGLEDGVKGLRIAFSPRLGYAKVDPEVASAVAAAAKVFVELGAQVEETDPGFDSPRDAFYVLWATGGAKVVASYPPRQHAQMDQGLVAMAKVGENFSARDYLDAEQIRAALILRMNLFQRKYDLLLTPTVAVPALPVGPDLNDPASEKHWIDWTPFSYPFNMTRQPAISVPCGLTKAGLPIGLQLVGRLHDDARVLRAARAYEISRPFPFPKIKAN